MKNILKRTITAGTAALLSLMGLTGCMGNAPSHADDDTVRIIASNFALYDFARLYESDGIVAEMLIAPGSESHDLEATLADISTISSADIFIYAGGESDLWVDAAFESLKNAGEGIIRINALSLITGEVYESHEHHDHEDENHAHESHAEADEHVWTSIPNAITLIEEIGKAIEQADETKTIPDKAADYIQKLSDLDTEYRQTVSDAARTKIAVADRFPFTHMAREYNISYSAAFEGCSSNVEVPLSVINDMIGEVKAESLPAVFYIEFSDRTAGDTVCGETGAIPLLLHSCHNVTKAELESGVTYLDLMTQNLAHLKQALN